MNCAEYINQIDTPNIKEIPIRILQILYTMEYSICTLKDLFIATDQGQSTYSQLSMPRVSTVSVCYCYNDGVGQITIETQWHQKYDFM